MSNIYFVIKDKYLLENTRLHPQPLKNFIPKWYKDIAPSNIKNKSYREQLNVVHNIKSCPSFNEIYQEGFVILAPNDYLITYDKDTKNWSWKTPIVYKTFNIPNKREIVEIHNNNQMVDYLPDKTIKAIFKIKLPYRVVTDNGYSIRQTPIPYSYNKEFEAMYGIFKSDKIHEVNVQIAFKSNKKEILIKQGQPLCVFYPYKRENYNLKIVNEKNKIFKKVLVNTSNLYGSFFKKFKNIRYFLDTWYNLHHGLCNWIFIRLFF